MKNISFKQLIVINKWQCAISFFTIMSSIVMIVLLAIHQHHTKPYTVIGFIFLGISLLFLIVNFALMTIMSIKISFIEKEFELKFKGWVHLILGAFIFWLSLINLKKLKILANEMIKSNKNNDFI
ncbi:hypothetical protein [Ureaplasma ceti]|uniref:Uncharacterized protein n=1 Tax=Ureaplasma ceti TaxID=3119530 RepID=A0ABP9U565_9BACT